MNVFSQSNSNVTTITRRISLRKNFVWTLAGNIVYSGCQWGMLTIIAKLGNPIMVGQFALGWP